MLAQIEATYPAGSDVDNVHCIIVLGGGGDVDIWRCCNLPELVEGGNRFTAALKLHRQHPESIIVLTGGSGRLRDPLSSNKSESELNREFFIAKDI